MTWIARNRGTILKLALIYLKLAAISVMATKAVVKFVYGGF
jgi:hypothetical protein